MRRYQLGKRNHHISVKKRGDAGIAIFYRFSAARTIERDCPVYTYVGHIRIQQRPLSPARSVDI